MPAKLTQTIVDLKLANLIVELDLVFVYQNETLEKHMNDCSKEQNCICAMLRTAVTAGLVD